MNRYLFISIAIGLTQMLIFILYGYLGDWRKISEPIEYLIYYYIIMPSSIFFFLISPIYGWLYHTNKYRRIARNTLLINLLIATIISLVMMITHNDQIDRALMFICLIFIMISPFALLPMALVIRWTSQRSQGQQN
jgi:hypothetical protein